MIKITTEEQLRKLVDVSAYTITGAGGDLNEWVEGYTKMLEEQEIGTPQHWYTFKGKLMNDTYNLSGSNRYNNTITFLAFTLDNLDIGKLAIFKMKMGDRWLDDIVDNNIRREESYC